MRLLSSCTFIHCFFFDFFHITMEKSSFAKRKGKPWITYRPKLSVFSHEYSPLKPLSWLTPAIFLPRGISCSLSRLCPQRLMTECRYLPAACPASLERGGGGGLICTLMERSILPGLVWFDQLRVSGNFFCW
jgi:hypothetical protein